MSIRRKVKLVFTIIFVTILALSATCIISQLSGYHANKESVKRAIDTAKAPERIEPEQDNENDVQPAITPMPADPDIEFLSNLDIKRLQEINPDVVGWLLIPGTEISFPLLITENNDYYLKHSWDGEENTCGSIFYDYRSSPGDWNSVIYGHNMRNGSMFAKLHNYKEDNFQKENDRLLIVCGEEIREYIFVTAFEAELDGVPYLFGELSDHEKHDFLEELSGKAGQSIKENSPFITLSTCTGAGHQTRWVVVFGSEGTPPQAQARFLNEEGDYSMTQQEKFLALYKQYETMIRASGRDPKDAEAEAVELDSKRLYMCRQFRNYIAHVPDPKFIFPTENMLKFLQEQINKLKIQDDVAKKHLKRACILQGTDRVADAQALFSKLKRNTILVQGETGWLQLSVFDILGHKSTEKIIGLAKPVVPFFCSPLEMYVTLDFTKPVICTSDGTKEGKLLGQVWEK